MKADKQWCKGLDTALNEKFKSHICVAVHDADDEGGSAFASVDGEHDELCSALYTIAVQSDELKKVILDVAVELIDDMYRVEKDN